jgi:hypothetical protein
VKALAYIGNDNKPIGSYSEFSSTHASFMVSESRKVRQTLNTVWDMFGSVRVPHPYEVPTYMSVKNTVIAFSCQFLYEATSLWGQYMRE